MAKAKTKKELGTVESCECRDCVGACKSKPGWFSPDQMPLLEKHFGMPLKEVFRKYLAVDWLQSVYNEETGEYRDVFNLAPANDRSPAGGMYAGNPRGVCVFLEKGKCTIHDVKPKECAEAFHSMTSKESVENHQAIGREWNTEEFQQLVREVLGEEPEAESYSIFESFTW